MPEAPTRVVIQFGEDRVEVPTVLPVLPVRDVVVYPGITVPLAVGRPKSLAALEAAGQGGFLIVATQRDPATEAPGLKDLYPVACVVRVARIVDARREGKQGLVIGIARTRLGPPVSEEPAVTVRVDPMPDAPVDPEQSEQVWRAAIHLANQVIDLREDLPNEWKTFVSGIPSPGLFADLVASTLPLPPEEKVALLEETNPILRLERVSHHLEREVTIAQTQQALRDQSESEEIDPKRRERLLRRRMRDIESEIGEADGASREVDELREKIEAANLPEEAAAQVDREMRRLDALPAHAPDRHLVRAYIDWLVELPWSIETEDKLDLAAAHEVLDADHHDLEKVKDRILEFLAVRKLAPAAKGPILCFVGPPGVGKTSLGRSIARAMGRKFARASLGGVRDEAEIRGHRRTYVGAMPGRILQSLRRAGSRNPIFLLDEVDKLGADFRGDPSSALLEVLDPEQNNTFNDHYLEVDYDLSDVMFVTTANTLRIPPPLLDRMETIHLPGYTEDEKIEIAKRHLIPKQVKLHGLKAEEWSISEEALRDVIRYYTREAGVRNLERELAGLNRKSVKVIAIGECDRVKLTRRNLEKFAGVPRYRFRELEQEDLVGVATGLAWTEVGGEVLSIEAVMVPGKGKVISTGKLGDVMKESIQAAESYVKSRSVEFGIKPTLFDKKDIHVHVPEGATPKDGPSAGVAMVTAIVSALTGIPVHRDVALTGEITLRGRVLPIDGLKEKLLAALRGGLKTVVIPQDNEKDLAEIPDNVKRGLTIVATESVDEMLEHTLISRPTAIEWIEPEEVEHAAEHSGVEAH